MTPNGWWILVAMAIVGHFGLHLALYNRLNSFGWPRRMIKGIEKALFVEMLITPPLLAWLDDEFFRRVWTGDLEPLAVQPHLAVYGGVCLASWIVFGIPWLLWRPSFRLEWVDAPREIEVVQVERKLDRPLAQSWLSRLETQLPLNQVLDLAVEKIQLPVHGLPAELNGYRIAQLSDVHLTGDIHPDYARYAVERAADWQPELIALTGDLIDHQACIDWLDQIFSPAETPDGCYFILGNHDTRIIDSRQTRAAMDRAGWTDLGSRSLQRELRGVRSLIIGNEYPWFERPEVEPAGDEPFRLLLSHSPDQLSWARRHHVHLMLAGHTHGGQGQLPLAGPLLSPSWHGSRFASGDFYKRPTTMHVSRGIGGVHLMRVLCRPELSLITLQTVDAREDTVPR